MCFFRRRKQANLKAKEESVQKVEPVEKKVVNEPKAQPVEAKPTAKPTETKPTSTKPAPKKEVKVLEEKKIEPKEVKKSAPKYHVSQNKDSKSEHFKKWRVRQAGSDKTIKFYETQKEAIEAAKQFAESNDGSVVIHKVDGSIRKQDYSKKN